MCTVSLDHLVGAGEQRRWHSQPERLRRFQVDHQLIVGRRLYRQIARLLTLKDAVDVAGRLPVLLDLIGSIRDQTTRSYERTQEVERRQLVLRSKRDDQVAMKERQRAWRYNQAAIARAREQRALNLVGVARIKRDCLDGATDWIAPNPPVPGGIAGSRKTAARVTVGAISLTNSSHFPPKLYSKDMKPVALPPGRAGRDRIAYGREYDRHCV